jgi:hypothetical protein
MKKLVIGLLVAGALVAATPAKANGDVALGIIGGLFGGFILNEALQPRVYVAPQPYYERQYIPPPVYYAPQPVYRQPYCRYEYYRDSWGYVYNQRVCY